MTTPSPDIESRRCPASREAVEEMEERGEVGCPLCGRAATSHPSEDPR